MPPEYTFAGGCRLRDEKTGEDVTAGAVVYSEASWSLTRIFCIRRAETRPCKIIPGPKIYPAR